MSTTWTKDPDSTLDYVFDWSKWLLQNDTIVASNVTITPNGHSMELLVDNQVTASTNHVVWLKGGRVGVVYKVKCSITTKDGRSADKTATLFVANC